ncbi:MAG: glycosyltransferase family 2 protein [Salaquimonas sp.]|nr:glycosyltransferase family 2 protein [Salaquimonas sp.]
MLMARDKTIAILIPCKNEAVTIADVVKGFRKSVPGATVYVYDNNSTDDTAEVAQKAGAIVGREPRPGKGNVVRRMFSEVEADIYVLVDGDDTYDASQAQVLINKLVEEGDDMVVGARLGAQDKHQRKGHAFGNRMFNVLYSRLFGQDFSDIFSGYRVFSRRFVKSFPAVSAGFEIETELSVHASQLRLPVAELALPYRDRPDGSESKLSTFRDGARILKTIIVLLKEYKPFYFFGAIGLAGMLLAVLLAIPVFIEYAETGLVSRFPTAILCTGIMIVSMLTVTAGVVLDSIRRMRAEIKRMFYNIT